MKHINDAIMVVLYYAKKLDDLEDELFESADLSIDCIVKERNDQLEREVRDALGRHGAETGNYGPLNRFAEML